MTTLIPTLTASIETKAFTPSKYQQAIYDYIRDGTGHLVVKAVAGGAKTTTAVESLNYIPKDKKVLFLAFNKAIALTLQDRVPKNVKASTIHAYGFSVVKRLLPDSQMNGDKVYNIIQRLIKEEFWIIPKDERVAFLNRIEKLVNLMRLTLQSSPAQCQDICDQYGIECEDNEIEYALQTYEEVLEDEDTFDFTDMIFIPATCEFATKGFDFIYVDEFQDCSEAQYRFIRKLLKPDTGRLIVVGDPNQSIYSFLGAEPRLFAEALSVKNTIELPLSISYRCSKSVVKWAKHLVPHIEHREDAPDGKVITEGSVHNIQAGDFVLARTNFPLVCLCMDFIKANRKAVIRGSDIGRNLISILKPHFDKNITELKRALEKKLLKLEDRLRNKYPDKRLDNIPEYQTFSEKKMIIEAIAEKCLTVQEIITKIEALFSDSTKEGVILSTIHKAKGLEAKRVFIIEPQLIPFPYYMDSPGAKEQEDNINYVARTRAVEHLEYVRDWTCFKK